LNASSPDQTYWIKDVQKCTIGRVLLGVMIDMIIGLSTALALTGPAVAAETGTAKLVDFKRNFSIIARYQRQLFYFTASFDFATANINFQKKWKYSVEQQNCGAAQYALADGS